jgi:Transglutaminase-like superfamily
MRFISDKSLPARVSVICDVMKQEGIVAARDSDYYAVGNSFIHLALEGRGSLPITMAIIFVGIARRCGIAAAPVNHVISTSGHDINICVQPGHVFVAVSSSPEFRDGDIFHVDVFNGGTIHRDANLTGPNIVASAASAFRPGSVSSMMCRVSRNIVNAINGRPTTGLELSWFAALSSVTILDPDNYLFARLCDVIRTHPSLNETDLDIIEGACGSQQFEGSDDHMEFCRQERYYDQVGRPPRLKSEDYWMVRFSIGQVFTHRMFK